MNLYLVEYPAPIADPLQLSRCLAVREVRWVRRLAARAGDREVGLFEAESAEHVRDAHRSAGVEFTAVWGAADAAIPE